MPICKQCKWYQTTQMGPPDQGECKLPAGEVGDSLPTGSGSRYRAKFVKANQDASNCPYFEMAPRGGKYHDII